MGLTGLLQLQIFLHNHTMLEGLWKEFSSLAPNLLGLSVLGGRAY